MRRVVWIVWLCGLGVGCAEDELEAERARCMRLQYACERELCLTRVEQEAAQRAAEAEDSVLEFAARQGRLTVWPNPLWLVANEQEAVVKVQNTGDAPLSVLGYSVERVEGEARWTVEGEEAFTLSRSDAPRELRVRREGGAGAALLRFDVRCAMNASGDRFGVRLEGR